MIEITFKTGKSPIGKLDRNLINIKTVTSINYSKKLQQIIFWFDSSNSPLCFKQDWIEENLDDVYQRAKILLAKGS